MKPLLVLIVCALIGALLGEVVVRYTDEIIGFSILIRVVVVLVMAYVGVRIIIRYRLWE